VNTVMNLRLLCKARSFLTSLVTVSFSRRTLFRGVSIKCGGCLVSNEMRMIVNGRNAAGEGDDP